MPIASSVGPIEMGYNMGYVVSENCFNGGICRASCHNEPRRDVGEIERCMGCFECVFWRGNNGLDEVHGLCLEWLQNAPNE